MVPTDTQQDLTPLNLTSLNNDTFWRFACSIYKQPNVSTELLALQDNLDANINLILLLAYLQVAQANHPSNLQQVPSINAEMIQALHKQVSQFSQAHTQLIRATRKQLQTSTALTNEEQTQLKQQLLNVELSAEKLEQARLLTWLDQHMLSNKTVSKHKNINGHYPALIEQYVHLLTLSDSKNTQFASTQHITQALKQIT